MQPDISLIVTTSGRSDHLARALQSISLQSHLQESFEVVIASDGECDATQSTVQQFAKRVDFSVTLTQQRWSGFRVARSRNNGAIVSRGRYLVFMDGDCLLPPGYLAWHVQLRRPGTAVLGDSYRLGKAASLRISLADVADFERIQSQVDSRERFRFVAKTIKSLVRGYLRVPMRPRLTGNNFGLWRCDFEAVNGFDECFVGWGLEDTDLQRRLEMAGVRFRTILHRAVPVHLWHEADPSFQRRLHGTPNHHRFCRELNSPWCQKGLSRAESMAASPPAGDRIRQTPIEERTVSLVSR